ncbi:helix-turn-helix transcriptional regulator [Streptomyces oceani]|uniref:helix-turn-helix transcriptional regulator n=1 Tax=Streptomyces oceani TaxID=1075402 RepID=UPI0008733E60|nr:LuxR C-terminal-related transcriptional regulator [Streptomyces oceani]
MIVEVGALRGDDGAQLLAQAEQYGLKVLAVFDSALVDDLSLAATLTCHGYVDRRTLGCSGLGDAVRRVTAGEIPMPAPLVHRLRVQAAASGTSGSAATTPGAHLTPRETEVLALLVEGLSNKQIARRLQLSLHGVKRLIGVVLAKLNCPNRTRAAAKALLEGLCEQPTARN